MESLLILRHWTPLVIVKTSLLTWCISTTNQWKFELKLRQINGRKKTLVAQVVCFKMPWIRDLSRGVLFNSNIPVINYFLLINYVTSEGTVSHNVLYYQQLSIDRWVFPLFSPDSDDRLSLNFNRFVILYSCDTLSVGLWTILFTKCCAIA